MIGSLLGRGGTTLSELQMISATSIKISQRGEFVAGTNNRVVTITGTTNNCQTAQFLISQKLSQTHVNGGKGSGGGGDGV